VARASAGELDALAAMGSITSLEVAGAKRLVGEFEDRVRRTVDEANRSTWGFGGFDAGYGLALFNLWFPSIARWDPLLALLRDRSVAAEHKRGSCGAIVAFAERVPVDVREQLAALIDDLKATRSRDLPGGKNLGGVPVTLAIAVGILAGAEANRAAARLAGGTSRRSLTWPSCLAADGASPCGHSLPPWSRVRMSSYVRPRLTGLGGSPRKRTRSWRIWLSCSPSRGSGASAASHQDRPRGSEDARAAPRADQSATAPPSGKRASHGPPSPAPHRAPVG